jgi:hypothetical protein
LQVEPGIAPESSDKKTQVLFILIELSWLFLEHDHKVFYEILVRGKVLSWFCLGLFLAPFHVFAVIPIPNLVSRTSSFSIVTWFWSS